MPHDATPPADGPSLDSGGSSTDVFPRAIDPRHYPAGPAPASLELLPFVDRALYKVEAEIARGGIGRILRARDVRLGRTVALKEMRFDPLGPGAARFVREVLITAKLSHPSIVTIYEAGRWPSGEPFYAMELVEGESLASALTGKELLEERLPVLPHVIAAAEAMAHAHSRRIVHRDLKPSNVLVGPFGETVVIDWGLAKDLGEPGAVPEPRPPGVGQPSSGHAITAAGAVMGTPAYMPREQAAGEPVDERADVYALGAILYHLVAGVPPYVSPHAPVILEEVLRGPPPPLGDREPQVPGELLTIVEKAMARDRAGRYPSARELAEDLRRFANGQIVSAHAYSQLERVRRVIRRNKVTVAVSVVGFVATSIVGAVIVQGMRDDRDHARLMQEEAEQRCGR